METQRSSFGRVRAEPAEPGVSQPWRLKVILVQEGPTSRASLHKGAWGSALNI